MNRFDHRLAYGLFVASGATGLVYEVTWFRNLSLIFGASFEATSIVLAAFMGGMSIGGLVFGRLADRLGRPLRVYGLLEIGVACFALVLPSLLRVVDAAYVGAATGDADGGPWLLTLRALMAFVLLAFPTFMMGATLPVVTRLLVQRDDQFGVRLSALYGSNTLGAVAGTLLAGFVLIPALGVWHTQLCAVAVNLAIGFLALVVDRRLEPIPARGKDTRENESSGFDSGESRLLTLVFWGTALSGFASLSLEVLWTRAISVAVGSSTYSFSVMLAAFLMGIAIGSWVYSWVSTRRLPIPLQFGVVCLLAGGFALLASSAIPRLPQFAIELNLALFSDLTRIRPLTTFLLAFLLMFVPCLFIGIAFPLANEARVRLSAGFAKPVGDTLALNTLGSIAGSLGAGYVMIPLIGLQRGMFLAAGLYLAYGVVVLATFAWVRPGARRAPIAGAAAMLVAIALFLPALVPPSSEVVLGAFSNNQLVQYVGREGNVDVSGELSKGTLRYYREGRSATVSVLEQDAYRSLSVNGKIVASDDPEDLRTQYMLAHVPILMNPNARSVLVIGMGAGTTLGGVSAHDDLEEIALAEIEPAMLGAEPLFAASNGNPLSDPRLRVYLEDGRNFLKTTNRFYDVITADPIHPWTRGSGYLYTEEYYRLAAGRLGDGGVMCQWLPVADLTPDDFKSVVATFAKVFPHVQLWHSTSAILVGSADPLEVEIPALARRMAQPRVARQLEFLGIDDPLVFLGELQLVDEQVRRFAGDAIINTDDNLHLEFSSPLAIGGDRQVWSVLEELHSFPPGRSPLPEGDEQSGRLAKIQGAKTKTVLGTIALRSPDAERRVSGFRSLEAVVAEFPDYVPAAMALSEYLAQRSVHFLEAGNLKAGVRDARRAIELMPLNAMAHRALGTVQLQVGRTEVAVESFERAVRAQPRDWRNHLRLADALDRMGKTREATEALEAGLEIHPTNDEMNALRLEWRKR